jgi:hypothetical protein
MIEKRKKSGVGAILVARATLELTFSQTRNSTTAISVVNWPARSASKRRNPGLKTRIKLARFAWRATKSFCSVRF